MFIGLDFSGVSSHSMVFTTPIPHSAYDTVTLSRGQMLEMDISRSTATPNTTPLVAWQPDTALHAALKGNLEAGNLIAAGTQIDTVLVQRRLKTELTWHTIGEAKL